MAADVVLSLGATQQSMASNAQAFRHGEWWYGEWLYGVNNANEIMKLMHSE